MLALPSVPFIPSLLCPLLSLGMNVAVEKAPAVVTSGVEAIQHRSSGPDGRSDICVAKGLESGNLIKRRRVIEFWGFRRVVLLLL